MATDRNIFSFEYNGKTVYRDPMLIEDRFWVAIDGADFGELEEESNSKIPTVKLAARKRMTDILHKAFGTKPLDEDTGSGLGQEELMDISTAFWKFRSAIKKNGESLAEDSLPTDDQNSDLSPPSKSTENTSTSM